MENEEWYDVKDEKFYGLVEVSNLGRARYKDSKEICKLADNGAGYLAVYKQINKRPTLRYIHRLVAQVFHPNPNNYPQVGHKDDDKSNNHPDNLYWCTGSRNIRDAHKTGRMKKRVDLGSTKRYDRETVEAAYRDVKNGEGVSKTASKYDLPRTTLSSMINKRSWAWLTDEIDEKLHLTRNTKVS